MNLLHWLQILRRSLHRVVRINNFKNLRLRKTSNMRCSPRGQAPSAPLRTRFSKSQIFKIIYSNYSAFRSLFSLLGKLMIVISFSLQPCLVLAKKITPIKSIPLKANKARLSDNLLTSKQLLALPPVEQARYIIFLYHFVAAFEMLENKSKIPKFADAANVKNMNSYVYLSQFLESLAYAKEDPARLNWGNISDPALFVKDPKTKVSFEKNMDELLDSIVRDNEELVVKSDKEEKKTCVDKWGIPYNNTTSSKDNNKTFEQQKGLEPCPPEPEKEECTDIFGTPFNITYDKNGQHITPKPCKRPPEPVRDGRCDEFDIPNNNAPYTKDGKEKFGVNRDPDCIDKKKKVETTDNIVTSTQGQKVSGGEILVSNVKQESGSKSFTENINPTQSGPFALNPKDIEAHNKPRNSSLEVMEEKTSHLDEEHIIKKSQQESGTCIFGMWISKYKEMPEGSGSFKCTRPEGSKDNACDIDKNGQPLFRCNTMGFSKYLKTGAEGLPEESCIPLYSDKGLQDLTVRCVEKSYEWMDRSLRSLDKDQYDLFISGLKQQLNDFEDSRTSDGKMTFKQYCQVNMSFTVTKFQKTECTALKGLIDKYNSYKDSYEEQQLSNAPSKEEQNN